MTDLGLIATDKIRRAAANGAGDGRTYRTPSAVARTNHGGSSAYSSSLPAQVGPDARRSRSFPDNAVAMKRDSPRFHAKNADLDADLINLLGEALVHPDMSAMALHCDLL